jgi:hypothetical protein
VAGEHLAQVDNRDPFAAPVWRSSVYRTPEPVIFVVQLIRLLWQVLWFAFTHPLLDAMTALVVATWLGLGWPGVADLAATVAAGLIGLRMLQPEWFARFVAVPVRDWFRWWFYRRRWKAAMMLAGLAPDYRDSRCSRCSPTFIGPGRWTWCGSAWSPGRLPPTSPTGPRTWRTRSAPGCAGSATSRPAPWCWN